MKNKYKVIVCSNSAIDYLDYDKNIDIFRSMIHFGDTSYNDYIDLDAKTFYERIKKEPNNIPKTSYVAPGFMLDVFDKLLIEGHTDVLVIVIAKPLSGLHDAVLQVAKETKIKVHVYDSKTLAYPESYMAITAQKMFDLGGNLKEVFGVLNHIRDNHKMYFAVDTLLYLVKNGRLSKLSGTLGSILKVKPVLTLSKDGKVETLEKIRTSKKALERIVELYLQDTVDKNVITFISHAHHDEGVEWIKNKVHEIYPDRKIISSYLTPVVGAHCGPKAISIGYIIQK